MIPKASRTRERDGKGRLTKSSTRGRNGRGATGVPDVPRHRLKKLAKLDKQERHTIARRLQEQGKDATVTAVLRELKEAEIKQERKAFEARRDKGARVADLQAMIDAGETFPLIAADFAWEFKTYSEKGEQRSPKRHYDTSSLEANKAFASKYIAPLLAKDSCSVAVGRLARASWCSRSHQSRWCRVQHGGLHLGQDH